MLPQSVASRVAFFLHGANYFPASVLTLSTLNINFARNCVRADEHHPKTPAGAVYPCKRLVIKRIATRSCLAFDADFVKGTADDKGTLNPLFFEYLALHPDSYEINHITVRIPSTFNPTPVLAHVIIEKAQCGSAITEELIRALVSRCFITGKYRVSDGSPALISININRAVYEQSFLKKITISPSPLISFNAWGGFFCECSAFLFALLCACESPRLQITTNDANIDRFSSLLFTSQKHCSSVRIHCEFPKSAHEHDFKIIAECCSNLIITQLIELPHYTPIPGCSYTRCLLSAEKYIPLIAGIHCQELNISIPAQTSNRNILQNIVDLAARTETRIITIQIFSPVIHTPPILPPCFVYAQCDKMQNNFKYSIFTIIRRKM